VNDPHVENVRYRLVPDESLRFNSPPPLEHETDALKLRLQGGVLIVWLKDHYASEDEAKEAVDSYLQIWVVYEALESRRRRKIRFDYQGAKLVDRDPSSHDNGGRRTASASLDVLWSTAEAVETRSDYPKPPRNFALSPDVETMWERYEGYLKGREPLLSMAYFCLTVLELSARNVPGKGGNREKALRAYVIQDKVLSKLGELTARLGGAETARKAGGAGRPPTPSENEWIERCVLALVRRAGERAANPQKRFPLLTMAKLPKL
jgi:hypothetical protein